MSSGAVIWVYMSEIFPNAVRVKGQALGSTTLWVMNGVNFAGIPLDGCEILFATLHYLRCTDGAPVRGHSFFFPETKGFSLEELEARLQ